MDRLSIFHVSAVRICPRTLSSSPETEGLLFVLAPAAWGLQPPIFPFQMLPEMVMTSQTAPCILCLTSLLTNPIKDQAPACL